MTHNIYGITKTDLFRLVTAYSAIKNPAVRAEFLQAIEAWAQDQWTGKGRETS